MKTTFDTSEFKRSHGRKPGGLSGSWAFMPEGSGDSDTWLFSPDLTYAAAKRWAKDQMPDCASFTVGP